MVRSLYGKFMRDTMVVVTVLIFFMIIFFNVVNVLTIKRYSRKMAEEKAANAPAAAETNAPAELPDVDHAFGKFSDYYIAVVDANGNVQEYLDSIDQRNSVFRFFMVTVCMGTSMWVITLFIVTLLSRSSLVPVVKNMEEQKRFVTDAGHELKTPLSIILANLDAMEIHEGKNKWTERIRKQTLRLDQLMQNLLEFARLDEKNAAREKETFDASKRLNAIIRENEERFELHDIQIKKDISENLKINWYMDDFEKLCDIFLDNAAKYALRGSELEVTLKKPGKDIVMEFSNKCEKLPDCDPEKIFARFYRGDDSRSYEGKGSFGVGLAMARAMIRSAGGKISARYEDDDTIIFTVVFREGYLTT